MVCDRRGKGTRINGEQAYQGKNSNVLRPKNPGFTVFWTAGRAIAHEAEKQGVGTGEQCATASGQELTLNRPGSQGARCAVRLWGANWSMQGHRRPALSSAQAHFERARGDKQGGSAPRLPRPHLGSGTTPSNYLFERHAQAQRGAPTPSPPLPSRFAPNARHCALKRRTSSCWAHRDFAEIRARLHRSAALVCGTCRSGTCRPGSQKFIFPGF